MEVDMAAVSDRTRADVYARDRAICSYTGASLWVLNVGAVPFVEGDWVDHLKIASNGGAHTVDNLVCSAASANYYRNSNPVQPPRFYSHGRPTSEFAHYGLEVSAGLARRLRSQQRIVASDWYFNRALHHLVAVVQTQVYRLKRPDGLHYKRTPLYWLGAALRRLDQWRTIVEKERIPHFERRGLVQYPQAPETKLFLHLREARSVARLQEIARQLKPIFKHNSDSYYGFLDIVDRVQRKRAAQRILADASIHPTIKSVVSDVNRRLGFYKGHTHHWEET
jgi:hypothetical protein